MFQCHKCGVILREGEIHRRRAVIAEADDEDETAIYGMVNFCASHAAEVDAAEQAAKKKEKFNRKITIIIVVLIVAGIMIWGFVQGMLGIK